MSTACPAVKTLLLCASSGLILVACGGASEDGGSTPPVDYSGYQSQLTSLQTAWGGVAITDPATLPTSGFATFDGVLGLTVQKASGALHMAGALTLTSDFFNDRLGGNAANFVDEFDVVISGNLAITGGVLDRGADTSVTHTFSANIDGTLSGGGDSFLIGGDLSGDYLGLNYLGMVGVINGIATSNFGTGFMFGDFFAEQ